MLKLVFSLRRRAEMTREEFQAYWRDHHASLVSRHAETLRIRRYIQTHARSSELAAAQSAARGSEPDVYDGEAELWWDNLEDIKDLLTIFGKWEGLPESIQTTEWVVSLTDSGTGWMVAISGNDLFCNVMLRFIATR